jgi:hypothetical protein
MQVQTFGNKHSGFWSSLASRVARSGNLGTPDCQPQAHHTGMSLCVMATRQGEGCVSPTVLCSLVSALTQLFP